MLLIKTPYPLHMYTLLARCFTFILWQQYMYLYLSHHDRFWLLITSINNSYNFVSIMCLKTLLLIVGGGHPIKYPPSQIMLYLSCRDRLFFFIASGIQTLKNIQKIISLVCLILIFNSIAQFQSLLQWEGYCPSISNSIGVSFYFLLRNICIYMYLYFSYYETTQ